MSAPSDGEVGAVVSVGADDGHRFSKPVRDHIELVAGHGVAGDTHAGASAVQRIPGRGTVEQPNLRQVHLLSIELLARFADLGFVVQPGDLGENVLTSGIDLHALPTGAHLHLGTTAILELTGQRNPCKQMDDVRRGLQKAALERDDAGGLLRRVGVLAVVVGSGGVRAGDDARLEVPATVTEPLPVL